MWEIVVKLKKKALHRQVFGWKDIMLLDFFKGWFQIVQEVNILVNFQMIRSWMQLKYVILRAELKEMRLIGSKYGGIETQ